MSVEKRLYIILAEKLELPDKNISLIMSCGRNMAQAVHVGSKLKIQEKLDANLETTTVILKVPYSFDLEAVLENIIKAKVPWATFLDTNPEVYGTTYPLLTAVACLASKKKGKSLFYGVPSWKCDNPDT